MKAKTIVLTGGGSGGHITPILSVAEVLTKEAPEYKLVYVGQKNDPMVEHMKQSHCFLKYTLCALASLEDTTAKVLNNY